MTTLLEHQLMYEIVTLQNFIFDHTNVSYI